jgi:glyoxylase-like metal-dependent hydrolase (beta-lactamase superfamily II)
MDRAIIPIRTDLPLNRGQVNCYLVPIEVGFALVDTGNHGGRAAVDQALLAARCRPGDLRLIVLTHGDFDHTGNAAYLRGRHGAPVAMHAADADMLACGDMFAGRSGGNGLLRWLAPRLFHFTQADHATPDVLLAEGGDLGAYGWGARVVEMPGHSRGSIGILTDGRRSVPVFVRHLLENRSPASPSTA